MIQLLFDSCSIDRKKHSIDLKELSTDETWKIELSAEFSSDYSKSLKMFQVLWTVLWNIFNSTYMHFDKI